MSEILHNASKVIIKFLTTGNIDVQLAGMSMATDVYEIGIRRKRDAEATESWLYEYIGNNFTVSQEINGQTVHSNEILDEINHHINGDICDIFAQANDYGECESFVHYEYPDFTVLITAEIVGAGSVIRRPVEDEMEESYLDYAMSVIVGRALPDARDGAKPVHRRALFAMQQLGNVAGTAYKKSARIVGDVIGKYHPHGDTAVYDTIVRMAQPFSLRYPLVDGQGNFGSIDGDSQAAMRYTEVRLEKITNELLADLECDTVDYVPNYDGTEMIPEVLPTRIPNLLANGSSGIAVGMATNIPPHNLTEVMDACIAYAHNPEIDSRGLMEYISGPDFPTGGEINGVRGIEDAYLTGRGKIYIRAKAHIETDSKGRESIIVTEIPYQVNKARMIEKIAELVKDRKLDGISHIRDESDKDGMRVVFEIKRDAVADVVLNNLYNQSQLQTSFGINMVALENGQPKTFDLRGLVRAFINHRLEVIVRRTIFLRDKAERRKHLLDGLMIAHANIDEIVKLIRESTNSRSAQEAILARAWNLELCTDMESQPTPEDGTLGQYLLTKEQVEAIVSMRLYQLTGLELDKVVRERDELLVDIKRYTKILDDHDELIAVLVSELEETRDNYGDERRTEINLNYVELMSEDLIEDEQVVLTMTNDGYIKYQSMDEYNEQRRGGKGKSVTSMKDEDSITMLQVCKTHDTVLCFTDLGRVYWTKVYQLPHGSRGSRGKPIVNILPVQDGEGVTAILPVREYADDKFIVMATELGQVKKVAMSAFSRPRSAGIIAMGLAKDDCLIGAAITDGSNEIMLFTDNGKVVRFPEDQVRSMGRTAAGVRGIKLIKDGIVTSLVVPVKDSPILTITERGYGKLTALEEYPIKGRGTQGVASIKVSERNGNVVAAMQADPSDTVMMVTNGGVVIRTCVRGISLIGRTTSGVRLMFIDKNDHDTHVVAASRVIDESDAMDEAIAAAEEE